MDNYTRDRMQNVALLDHPLVQTTHVFRPNDPPYDAFTDPEPGVLLVGNGMEVVIQAAFKNWNGVEDLTVYWCYVPETNEFLHLSHDELFNPRPLDELPEA